MDTRRIIRNHITRVQLLLKLTMTSLYERSFNHDLTKLHPPEFAVFDAQMERLQKVEFGSEEYKQALRDMRPALEHHYAHNRHHPEHFIDGVDGMTIIDLAEMICDWYAAASEKGDKPNMDYLTARFKLSPQLRAIIENTFEAFDKDIVFVNIDNRRQNARIHRG